MNDYEARAFAVAEELTRAEIHRQNPEAHDAARLKALQIYAIDPSELKATEVHIGGGWFVVRNSSGEWRELHRKE